MCQCLHPVLFQCPHIKPHHSFPSTNAIPSTKAITHTPLPTKQKYTKSMPIPKIPGTAFVPEVMCRADLEDGYTVNNTDYAFANFYD